MSRLILTLIIISTSISVAYITSCNKSTISVKDNIAFKPKLSDYNIYTGIPGSISHQPAYKLYEIATPLFSDYTEKQRLIKLPPGTRLTAIDDGLPDFPDSTILVKTFYYFKNKADTSSGKRIIETRLLIKNKGKWNAATYMWNNEQTDASLISAGVDVPINWIDEQGQPIVISYHIPGKIECGMCHQHGKNITPIGPKIRNLNFNIHRNGNVLNQLEHLQNEHILATLDPASYAKLPEWNNSSFSLEQRARAYLDVNCAHCHNDKGMASGSSLELTFQTSLNDSKIARKKQEIDRLMSRGAMPLIGTTVVDKKGLQLIRDYLNSIR